MNAIDTIEPAITKLVQDAPVQDPATIERLRVALERIGTPLARSISRIVELVSEHLVDPGIALPALAEACATLVAGERGAVEASVLEAARYQIDTLQPVPDRPIIATPDVPLLTLRRRDR